MALCHICEKLQLSIVSSGQSSEGVRLFATLQALKKSAKTCNLCNLFLSALSNVRIKGIKNGSIQLHTWASDAQGDPIGMSRVFVKIGNSVGRFIDVFAEQGTTFVFSIFCGIYSTHLIDLKYLVINNVKIVRLPKPESQPAGVYHLLLPMI